jgi:hypothetical protein
MVFDAEIVRCDAWIRHESADSKGIQGKLRAFVVN